MNQFVVFFNIGFSERTRIYLNFYEHQIMCWRVS